MTFSRRTGLAGGLALLASALAGCTRTPPPASPSPQPPSPVPTPAAPTASATPSPSPTPTWTDPLPAGPFTALLLGTDTWEDPATGRPDAILVAQLTAARDHLALVSLPRDAWVPIDGGREGKVNSGFGGDVGRMTRTVSSVLGDLPIHATALTGFAGYTAIVEALGEFHVENAIESTFIDPNNGRPSHFPKGRITLTPEDWLVYARQRKELPRGDLDRTARHRAILLGMLARVRELATGPDAAGLAGLAAAALAHVRVTGQIGPEALLAYAPRLAGLGLDDVTALMVPVSGFGTKSGQSVTLLDAGLTADLAAALASGDVREYAAQTAGNPRTR
ncbi:LCP family protein [Propioniciclava sp. MC1595]|uniref:LCP family protein n=1 Tax=Propioniciclava sp. MC1595 TaxID=2760308 RepID=UPI0016621EB8|nr:LCP family protein [Propioniciclava sp. MC1595]MBB1495428.1 LCP family protein [Propioniciclava sp. MC1595]QTE26596.1 LCP family protein [Propioniciclava sp. MC1595]